MNAIHVNNYPLHKIINIRQVVEYTGLSRLTIYEIINPKTKYYDASFPKQVNLTTSRVGWVASEINDWIQVKISQR
ncbi:AlpA family phage regulatory protein [Alkanindiges illinoisensis]|uniref:AlpA family phage regulatory protein n=1 Tax=Alkanindiges illinoisensis TaxID=197183 RepID=A0A4Y7XAN4_9GAMM|nr:AlpA family phage regulatory protein [Alkanindiges illinoisensis]TEU24917.1 AlpA family phage regulatory protein [Alkanindiges illinoisensis]